MFKIYTLEGGKTKLFARVGSEELAKEIASDITVDFLEKYAFVIEEREPIIFSTIPKQYKQEIEKVLKIVPKQIKIEEKLYGKLI